MFWPFSAFLRTQLSGGQTVLRPRSRVTLTNFTLNFPKYFLVCLLITARHVILSLPFGDVTTFKDGGTAANIFLTSMFHFHRGAVIKSVLALVSCSAWTIFFVRFKLGHVFSSGSDMHMVNPFSGAFGRLPPFVYIGGCNIGRQAVLRRVEGGRCQTRFLRAAPLSKPRIPLISSANSANHLRSNGWTV